MFLILTPRLGNGENDPVLRKSAPNNSWVKEYCAYNFLSNGSDFKNNTLYLGRAKDKVNAAKILTDGVDKRCLESRHYSHNFSGSSALFQYESLLKTLKIFVLPYCLNLVQ